MKSIIIQEQKRYSRKALNDKFGTTKSETISIIKKLKELNILKTVKKDDEQLEMSDLLDEYIEIVDEEEVDSEHLYVFTFVGIILVHKIVLKCYPKYLINVDDDENLEEKLRIIIKVLQQYHRHKEQIINLYLNSNNNKSFNLLTATVYLMNDYYENGIYTNEQITIEENGNGEIDWNRTINDTYPLIKENKPYYFELFTRKRTIDDYDYFKRLHEIVLTKCSRDIEEAGLMNILGLSEIYLSDDTLEQLGDREYILKKLKDEKHEQYNTRKLELLSILEAYINNKGTLHDIDNFSVFGTNSFNLVWEEVCRSVLHNHLKTKIKKLELPKRGKIIKDNKDETLLSIIEKPFWKNKDGIGGMAKDTLIPDMITVETVNGEFEFDIFDAKYYKTEIGINGAKWQPGIESVVKQYVYQMAYENFINGSGIKRVNNYFLMPMDDKEGELVQIEGSVEMEMFNQNGINQRNKKDIKVRKLNANRLFEYYIKGRKIRVEELKLSDDK